MSAPSQEEKKLIKEFRGRLGDVLKTTEQGSDVYLLRWLRARDLSLEKAEGMLRNSLKWREEQNVDNALKRPVDPWMKLNYPFWVLGHDLQGRPVCVMPMGCWDLRKAVDRNEELVHYVNYLFETLMQVIKDSNKNRSETDYPISQMNFVVDWSNYSYGQLMHLKALQSLLKMAGTYEAHYPEILFRAFFVNCPSIFPMVMKVLKPVLAANTLLKISCHSSPKDWEPLVYKLISRDQLPQFIGGTHPINVQ